MKIKFEIELDTDKQSDNETVEKIMDLLEQLRALIDDS